VNQFKYPRSALALGVSLIALFGAGCKKKRENVPLNPTQVHAITREMQRSAWRVLRKPDSIESRLDFDGVYRERSDRLRIALTAKDTDPTQTEAITRIIQSLDRTATSHLLTRDPESRSDNSVRWNYRRNGVLTQSVELVLPNAAAHSAFPQQTGTALLAIILDDLGNDRTVAEAIFALRYPLTLSVLPNHAHSVDIAEEAHRRGYEVMLHLPMQSVANEKPEPQELRPGMAAADVTELVDQLLKAVPEVVGVNNHQGSQSTADTRLMHELMPILREHQLFYVDSRTTTATVAFDAARRDGVRAGFRNVPFLDDVAEKTAVRKQLQLALHGARQKGEAIAIGHPHSATLQALTEVLPQANAQGVRLVFASEVVH
jgi:uncharacterized protein